MSKPQPNLPIRRFVAVTADEHFHRCRDNRSLIAGVSFPFARLLLWAKKAAPEVFCIMPIYEYACPKCRVIFSFLSKRLNPDRLPVCPTCGNNKMTKQISRFAMVRGLKEPSAKTEAEAEGPPMPDLDDRA
jgi:putative FmdB family regulatory protein